MTTMDVLVDNVRLSELVEAVLLVADGDPGLSEETRERLSGLNDSVDIQVFATPT